MGVETARALALDADVGGGASARIGGNWKNGQVPFCFHKTCKGRCRQKVKQAAQRINAQVPCVSLKFTKRKGCRLRVWAKNQGCYWDGRIINLDKRGCQDVVTAEHE